MKCVRCSEDIPEGSSSCPGCGLKVRLRSPEAKLSSLSPLTPSLSDQSTPTHITPPQPHRPTGEATFDQPPSFNQEPGPPGDKFQTTKRRISAIGKFAMVLALIVSGIIVFVSMYAGNGGRGSMPGFWALLLIMIIHIILAGMGGVAFMVGPSHQGRVAYVVASLLSAFMLGAIALIYFGRHGISGGYLVGFVLISIGWVIGLIAGISGIVVTLLPTNRV